MKLTRKRAIELCIELWTWLAETGAEKRDWPEWGKYGYIENHCWFCEYQVKQEKLHPNASSLNKDALCRYCPLTSIDTGCQEIGHLFLRWDEAKTPRTRKKYAGLFLKQIKSLRKTK